MADQRQQMYRIRLTLEPRPEGWYTVTSPNLPELLTEGDTVEDVMVNVQDAFRAVTEMYEAMNRPLPEGLCLSADEPLAIDTLVARE